MHTFGVMMATALALIVFAWAFVVIAFLIQSAIQLITKKDTGEFWVQRFLQGWDYTKLRTFIGEDGFFIDRLCHKDSACFFVERVFIGASFLEPSKYVDIYKPASRNEGISDYRNYYRLSYSYIFAIVFAGFISLIFPELLI